MVLIACKKPKDPPTMQLSATMINLNSISSASKAVLNLTKVGDGTITYTVTTDKSWLLLSKSSGTLETLADSLKLSTQVPNSSLLDGDNVATLTIIPTINGEVSTSVKVTVNGNFKTTTLISSNDSLNVGIIKGINLQQIDLSKSGLENLTYEVTLDQTWITVDKPSGNISEKSSLIFKIDPNQLTAGPFKTNINIKYSVNDVFLGTKTIPVSGIYDNVITGTIIGHTLTKDEIWGGQINLNGTVIVPDGFKLTINPGTKVAISKQSTLTSIVGNGNLFFVGTPNNIIEFYSSENTPSNKDWGEIDPYGNAQIAYCLIRNALNGLNFEGYGKNANPTIAQVIHHILFDNISFGIFGLNSNYSTNLSYLSFRNYQYYGISITKTPGLNINNSEFLDPNGYIDIAISGSNQSINLNNCNFTAKTASYKSQMEALAGNSNNLVTSTKCYNILQKNGFNTNGNSYVSVNPLSTPNSNVGCGFVTQYGITQSNISYQKSPSQIKTSLNKLLK